MKNNILERKNKYTDLVTVRELLSGNHFYRIPDYQRGYAWEREFCELWRDILRLYRIGNSRSKHYTGMLALQEIKENSIEIREESLINTISFYIVDGQQRITSLIIIIKSLLESILEEDENFCSDEINVLLKSDYDIYKFGYSIKRKDDAANYFQERIFNSNKNIKYTDQYSLNINNAKQHIDSELKKFDVSDMKAILSTILDQLVFNIYFVTEEFDVRLTFETMNNRGKKLSKLELLKNRLMYLSMFFPPETNLGNYLVKIITETWQKIYSNLCFKDIQLSDDEYLKAHWIVYKRLDKAKGDSFINDILNNEFSIDNGEISDKIIKGEYNEAYKKLKNYVESLGKYSLYWGIINRPEESKNNLDINELEWIKRLSRLGDIMFLKATLMVIIGESQINFTDKERFYLLVEQFIFINKLLAQDKNDMSFLISVARDLMLAEPHNKTKEIKKLCSQIEDHELHIDETRAKYAITAFGLYISDKKNHYYDWNGLKYFLYEYNDSLKIDNASPIEWYKISQVSVEHVFPQTPATEYWRKSFEKYIDTEQQSDITNTIGNLLLLSSGSENSSLKNFSYPVKRDMAVESFKFGYTDGSRSARKVAEQEHWTPKQIYERSCELLNFMYERWFKNIPNFTKEAWNACIETAKLITFEYIDTDIVEYNDLIKQLDKIDTSSERTQVVKKTITTNPKDYIHKELIEYFDTDIIPIEYNSSKVSYKSCFKFKIIKDDAQKTPVKFECGVLSSDKKIHIYYDYIKNEIAIKNVTEQFYYETIEQVDDKIKLFLRSFFKYLRRAQDKTTPEFWKES